MKLREWRVGGVCEGKQAGKIGWSQGMEHGLDPEGAESQGVFPSTGSISLQEP